MESDFHLNDIKDIRISENNSYCEFERGAVSFMESIETIQG